MGADGPVARGEGALPGPPASGLTSAGASTSGKGSMEIVVSPPPRTASRWVRLLVVLGICLPVTMLALLPICFSLDRYVVTGGAMGPSLSRGTLLVERAVPVSDLRVGDEITFHVRHVDGDRRVTRRVLAVHDGQVTTKADAAPAADPWTLDEHYANVGRVVVAVPWAGYCYLLAGRVGPVAGAGLVLVGAVLLTVATASGARGRRAGRRRLMTAGI